MKLWKKISWITGFTILLASGAFGGVVLYKTWNYNFDQTIENYKAQMTSTAYGLEREIEDSNISRFGEVTRNSFLKFTLEKYAGSDYILLRDGEEACNLTNYEVTEASKEHWKTEEIEYSIQGKTDSPLLIMGKELNIAGRQESYQLVMIKDISELYDDIKSQFIFFVFLYVVVTALAVNIIFWIIRRLLKPLNELEDAADAISTGNMSRRVRVRRRDEVGKTGEAFNQMADRIEEQMYQLELVSERQRQLLGSLTHELKTPMTSIIGYSDTLLHVKIGPEQQKKALEHIYRECRRLERLSGKMMNLIGLYNNEAIQKEIYPVKSLLERVEELERYHVSEKEMHLKMSCSMGERLMDIDLMESLLVNLIDNAIKASKAGDSIEVFAEGNRITVRDWGVGISPEEIPKITEAFYMVDKSRSKKAGGIGLGLALCKQIAALHGAHLEIESWLDEGTWISVVFDE